MSNQKESGFLGKIKGAALSAGLLEEEDSEEITETEAEVVTSAAPVTKTIAKAGTPEANPALVEQLRSIALAAANSPLMNSFMRDLKKAQQIEQDPAKVTKMALVFSDIPVSELIKEIETAIAANLAAHKLSFSTEVQNKRTSIEARFAERQQTLQAALDEDNALAEEVRKRLTKNTAELSSLGAEKGGEIAAVEKTESEALASIAVVESEINSLLINLQAAG